jgi:hypothetical protein
VPKSCDSYHPYVGDTIFLAQSRKTPFCSQRLQALWAKLRCKWVGGLHVHREAHDSTETEGWLIAGESAHGVRAAIDEAKKAESAGEEKCILVNISGHGFLDLDAYRSKVRLR